MGVVFVLCAGSAKAWTVQWDGNWATISEVRGEWTAYVTYAYPRSSGADKETVFCFIGPFRVEKNKSYSVQLRVGSGPWFDAPLTAYDHETLCAYDSGKASGLLGAIMAYGSLAIRMSLGGHWRGQTFYRGNLSDLMRK